MENFGCVKHSGAGLGEGEWGSTEPTLGQNNKIQRDKVTWEVKRDTLMVTAARVWAGRTWIKCPSGAGMPGKEELCVLHGVPKILRVLIQNLFGQRELSQNYLGCWRESSLLTLLWITWLRGAFISLLEVGGIFFSPEWEDWGITILKPNGTTPQGCAWSTLVSHNIFFFFEATSNFLLMQ